MGSVQNDSYRKGYVAGYRDGLKAAESGKAPQWEENDIAALPVQTMPISSRGRNCLFHAGYLHVADVILLDEQRIATMRNLGQKTASEIGRWLEEKGVYYTAWSRYI